MQVIVLAHAMQVYNLTEEKSRFYFNQSTLCWQLHCFVVFGFIKVLVNLFAFSMSCDCASRGIITSYSTHIYIHSYLYLLVSKNYPKHIYIFTLIPNCVSLAFELLLLLFNIIRISVTSVVLVHTFVDHEPSKWGA